MHRLYCGRYTFCGTYAVLNAIGGDISPEIFELATGVPFGISCVDMKSERLLTPYKNPNYGIDYAVNLWKIPYTKIEDTSKQNIFDQLCQDLENRNKRIVLGPLNMGKLFYIPLCNIYDGVDHYIFVQKRSDKEIAVMDSEGYLFSSITYSELYRMWDVRRVYEAGGKYTYRSYENKIVEVSREEIFKHIPHLIHINITEAEQAGQGSRAFLKAYEILNENSLKKWRLSFLYELEYLIQRKLLTYQYVSFFTKDWEKLTDILKSQISIIADIFHDIEFEQKIEREKFQKLSELESQLYLIV